MTNDYSRSLDRWTTQLAEEQIASLLEDLETGSTALDVERYLLNSRGERERMLQEELQFLAVAFEDLPAWVDRYLKQVPWAGASGLTPCDSRLVVSETPEFLAWLVLHRNLTAMQRDFIAYLQAEYRCLELAAKRQSTFQQFQRLRATNAQVGFELAVFASSESRIHLNPAWVWGELPSGCMNPEESVDALHPPPRPVALIIFATDRWIKSLRIDPAQAEMICLLASSPSNVLELHALTEFLKTQVQHDACLQTTLSSFYEAGLIAFSR